MIHDDGDDTRKPHTFCQRTHPSLVSGSLEVSSANMIHSEDHLASNTNSASQTLLLDSDIEALQQRIHLLEAEKHQLMQDLNMCNISKEKVASELAKEKKIGQRERTMANILSSDKQCMKYTGVPSLQKLHGILAIVNTQYPTIKYWSRHDSAKTKFYEEMNKNKKKPGPDQ